MMFEFVLRALALLACLNCTFGADNFGKKAEEVVACIKKAVQHGLPLYGFPNMNPFKSDAFTVWSDLRSETTLHNLTVNEFGDWNFTARTTESNPIGGSFFYNLYWKSFDASFVYNDETQAVNVNVTALEYSLYGTLTFYYPTETIPWIIYDVDSIQPDFRDFTVSSDSPATDFDKNFLLEVKRYWTRGFPMYIKSHILNYLIDGWSEQRRKTQRFLSWCKKRSE